MGAFKKCTVQKKWLRATGAGMETHWQVSAFLLPCRGPTWAQAHMLQDPRSCFKIMTSDYMSWTFGIPQVDEGLSAKPWNAGIDWLSVASSLGPFGPGSLPQGQPLPFPFDFLAVEDTLKMFPSKSDSGWLWPLEGREVRAAGRGVQWGFNHGQWVMSWAECCWILKIHYIILYTFLRALNNIYF